MFSYLLNLIWPSGRQRQRQPPPPRTRTRASQTYMMFSPSFRIKDPPDDDWGREDNTVQPGPEGPPPPTPDRKRKRDKDGGRRHTAGPSTSGSGQQHLANTSRGEQVEAEDGGRRHNTGPAASGSGHQHPAKRVCCEGARAEAEDGRRRQNADPATSSSSQQQHRVKGVHGKVAEAEAEVDPRAQFGSPLFAGRKREREEQMNRVSYQRFSENERKREREREKRKRGGDDGGDAAAGECPMAKRLQMELFNSKISNYELMKTLSKREREGEALAERCALLESRVADAQAVVAASPASTPPVTRSMYARVQEEVAQETEELKAKLAREKEELKSVLAASRDLAKEAWGDGFRVPDKEILETFQAIVAEVDALSQCCRADVRLGDLPGDLAGSLSKLVPEAETFAAEPSRRPQLARALLWDMLEERILRPAPSGLTFAGPEGRTFAAVCNRVKEMVQPGGRLTFHGWRAKGYSLIEGSIGGRQQRVENLATEMAGFLAPLLDEERDWEKKLLDIVGACAELDAKIRKSRAEWTVRTRFDSGSGPGSSSGSGSGSGSAEPAGAPLTSLCDTELTPDLHAGGRDQPPGGTGGEDVAAGSDGKVQQLVTRPCLTKRGPTGMNVGQDGDYDQESVLAKGTTVALSA